MYEKKNTSLCQLRLTKSKDFNNQWGIWVAFSRYTLSFKLFVTGLCLKIEYSEEKKDLKGKTLISGLFTNNQRNKISSLK